MAYSIFNVNSLASLWRASRPAVRLQRDHRDSQSHVDDDGLPTRCVGLRCCETMALKFKSMRLHGRRGCPNTRLQPCINGHNTIIDTTHDISADVSRLCTSIGTVRPLSFPPIWEQLGYSDRTKIYLCHLISLSDIPKFIRGIAHFTRDIVTDKDTMLFVR